MNINIEAIINGNVLSKNTTTITQHGSKVVITEFFLNISDNKDNSKLEEYPFEALYLDTQDFQKFSREWLASCLLRGDKAIFKVGPIYESFFIESIKSI